jgi:hypothetical protein
VEALGELNDGLAVMPLIQALQNPQANVRCAAAEALGKLKDFRAVEPLLAALQDTDCLVCLSAAQALARLKDRRGFELLIAALNDPEHGVRSVAAEALGELKDPRAVEPLIAALQDTFIAVSVSAATALGELQDSRAIGPLITALANVCPSLCFSDDEISLMSSIFQALRRFNDPQCFEQLLVALEDPRVIERLTFLAVNHPDPEVRASVGDVLLSAAQAAVHPRYSSLTGLAKHSLGEFKDPRAAER